MLTRLPVTRAEHVSQSHIENHLDRRARTGTAQHDRQRVLVHGGRFALPGQVAYQGLACAETIVAVSQDLQDLVRSQLACNSRVE